MAGRRVALAEAINMVVRAPEAVTATLYTPKSAGEPRVITTKISTLLEKKPTRLAPSIGKEYLKTGPKEYEPTLRSR
jgi:hypothetical protein